LIYKLKKSGRKRGTLIVVVLLVATLIGSDASLSAFETSIKEDSWTTKMPVPTARAGLGVAVADGKIYAIGGDKGNNEYTGINEAYDPEKDTWTTMEPMPTPRADFAIAVYQNKIYCIGGIISFQGLIPTDINEVYDPATNTWETKTAMPTPRYEMQANVVNGKIYVISGNTFVPDFSTKNEAYDPITDSWYTVVPEPIPTPFYYYSSAVIDNEIYIIGGMTLWLTYGGGPSSPPTNETWIYNTKTDEWIQGYALPYLVVCGAATVTTGVNAPQRIYVIGGCGGRGLDETTSRVSVYDPKIDVWTVGEEMPTSRFRLAVAVVNDKIYAIGGYSSGSVLAVNEQYTPIGYKEPKLMSIFVDSPSNKTYYTDTIKLQFAINKSASLITYSLDNKDNLSITENPTLTLSGLSDGSHSITVYAQDTTTDKITKSQTIYFTVKQYQKTMFMIIIIAAIAVTTTAIIYRYKTKKNSKKINDF
jgi:N-acetylneuraminic acid mutarotase